MKDEWNRFGQKAAAQNVLTQAMQSTKPIHPAYPYETKIKIMDLVTLDTTTAEIRMKKSSGPVYPIQCLRHEINAESLPLGN